MDINWKICSNFPRYTVSSNGDVFDSRLNKILPKQITKDGYEVITLNNGKRKTIKVHRLVATEFLENLENKATVNHKDGNKLNNNVANLEWATRSEQTQHAWNNKLIKDLNKRKEGIRQKQGIPVVCITTGEEWDSIGRAAEELGLKKSNISAACLKKKGFKTAGKTTEGTPREWRFKNEC